MSDKIATETEAADFVNVFASALASGEDNRAECARVIFECVVTHGVEPDKIQIQRLRKILTSALVNVIKGVLTIREHGGNVTLPERFDAASLL